MKCYFVILFLIFNITVAFTQKRQLDFFIKEAIANSPLLKDYQNQVKLNQLDSLLIRASQRPQLSFISNNAYAPVVSGYGYDKAITNGANLNALARVDKQIINNKNNAAQFASLKLLSNSIRNNAAISEQDLKKNIIGQYIITYGDLLQVNFSTEIQEMLGKQETVLKKLTEKNVYKQVDYLSFYVTLQQNEFKLKQQVYQYRNDYAMLNYLAGIKDTSQPALEEPELSLTVLPDINQSVFFKKFEFDSLALVNTKSLIDINYRPKLSVYADAGYNSSLAYLPYKNFGTSVGLSLLVPIYDGKQKRIQYSKIGIQENTRMTNKQFFTDQYYQQVAQLKQQVASITELSDDINTQLKYIETLIAVNEKLLQTGEVRIYDFIMSLNNFMNAKSMINENKINRLQLINQINYWNR